MAIIENQTEAIVKALAVLTFVASVRRCTLTLASVGNLLGQRIPPKDWWTRMKQYADDKSLAYGSKSSPRPEIDVHWQVDCSPDVLVVDRTYGLEGGELHEVSQT